MRVLGAVLVALAIAGCEAEEPDLTVYAAASLSDAFEDLAGAYEAETGVSVAFSFDASSTLRAQITEGAPADVFASADLANAEALVDAGLTDGDLSVFAENALAVVTPSVGPPVVGVWVELASPGIRIIAAGEGVPITGYAEELIANLAEEPPAPDGFADAYAANIVSREDNVRAVLAKIELGEGDAGIVYETDAAASDDVTIVGVPEDANVRAEYAVVILAGSAPGATDFVEWLLADTARGILASHGFRLPV
jgi:molybdate transport system substrate-binding protein